jgi:arylsulfatase A-like enzyme
MRRREFIPALAGAGMQSPAGRPNIVLIMSDDMGYADIEPTGAKDIRTPALARLAREGVRFTNCYSNGPVCTPTRAALMTGRYQQRMGLEWALMPADRPKGLQLTEMTVAKLLRQAGYRTALMGKWHLGMDGETLPRAHGFDEFYGLLSGNVDMYSHRRREGSPDWWHNETPLKEEGYGTELIAGRAVSWLEQSAKARQPFFLYLAWNAVHWPFHGPGRPQDSRNSDTWQSGTRDDYRRMLEAMDKGTGQVLATLDRLKAAGETLVIFTNDNGGERLSDNRPYFHHKATLWEGGIRVPGIMRWPGVVRAGSTSAVPCASMDLSTTIMAACGVKPGKKLDGIDLAPILAGRQQAPERSLCWRINRADRKQQAIRRGPWKLVRDGEIDQLFNLDEDPGERTDRFTSNQTLAASLRAELAAWNKDVDTPRPPFSIL